MIDGTLLLAALLLGLTSAPHCLAMCGGVACAAAGLPGQGAIVAHAARITVYALLGITAATLTAIGVSLTSRWFGNGETGHTAASLLRLLMGGLLLYAGVQVLRGRSPGWAPRYATHAPGAVPGAPLRMGASQAWWFGAGWAALPCGVTFMAIGLAATTADPLAGLLVMLMFGLATLPALGVAGLALRWLAIRPRLRLGYGVAVLLLGVVTVGHAFTMLEAPRGHHHDHRHSSAPVDMRQHPLLALLETAPRVPSILRSAQSLRSEFEA